ncbi:AraC family transcriptional regulator [Cohnella caldifontis]|uniref:AraC family transcriptional regulator n=1 Tax=Cohnella caldifontis TaxID=3027471 RepID=UPI0023EDE6DC|nr:AraC family transcriptional regulator [Cohnella sp. YIM B05605]
MTVYPMNKHLSDYEMISPDFPFYISLNEVRRYFPAHRHDFLECSLVVEGEGYETINGVRHPMSRGTFTWLLPYQVHDIVTTSPTPIRLYNCMFEMELLALSSKQGARHLRFLQVEQRQPYVQLEGTRMASVERLFAEMLDEYGQERPYRQELMLVKMHEALIHFQREQQARAPEADADEPDFGRSGSVWPVIAYIHAHYREELSLSELSAKFGLHPSRLSAEIKKHAGIGFLHLLHDIRLRHACSLLAATDMSILEIAVEVGFSSYKVFARVFRDAKGLTPGEYRKRRQAGEKPERQRESRSDR